MTSTWDPNVYLKFADHRLRPAVDLMARVPLADARTVYDLGCGPGNVTQLLAERWPQARITGVDSSPEMLATANATPGIAWQQADLAKWRAEGPADLVYSNAAFHWLDDHQALFPHLLGQVSSGGFLAIQMPRQHLNPSHQILFELVRERPWTSLADAIRENPSHEPARYYDWLAPHDKIVSMYARGMSVREIQGHLRELYGIEASPQLVSTVTDAVLDEVAKWRSRPLEALYAVVFFDALRVKIRDEGTVTRRLAS